MSTKSASADTGDDAIQRFLSTARKYINKLPESILALAEVVDTKPLVAVVDGGIDNQAGISEARTLTLSSPAEPTKVHDSTSRLSMGLDSGSTKIEPVDDDPNDGGLEDGEIADSDDDRNTPASTAKGNGSVPASVFQCPPKRRVCRYFRDGFCRNGVNCKFLHTGADSGCIPELCRAYAFGKCLQPHACKRLHGEYPCLAFHHGKCDNNRCRFSHQPPDEYTLAIIEKQNHQNHAFKPVRKVLLPTPPPAVSSPSSSSNTNFTPLPLVQPTRKWTEDPLIPQIMSLPSKNDAKVKPLTVKEINTMIKVLADESCPDDYFDGVIEEYWPKTLTLNNNGFDYPPHNDSWVQSSHDGSDGLAVEYPPNRKCRRAAEHRRSAPYAKKDLLIPKKEPMSPPMPLLPSNPIQPFNVLNTNAFSFHPPRSGAPQAVPVSESEREVLDRLAAQQMIMSNVASENGHVKYEVCERPPPIMSPWTTPPPPLLCHELPAFDPRRPPPPLPLNMLYSSFRG